MFNGKFNLVEFKLVDDGAEVWLQNPGLCSLPIEINGAFTRLGPLESIMVSNDVTLRYVSKLLIRE